MNLEQMKNIDTLGMFQKVTDRMKIQLKNNRDAEELVEMWLYG
jgi:hypothetical protein